MTQQIKIIVGQSNTVWSAPKFTVSAQTATALVAITSGGR